MNTLIRESPIGYLLIVSDSPLRFLCLIPGDSVVTKDITQYTKPLITIIENARTKKEKLTPLKLVEAWLRKGKSSLRVDSVPRPSLAKEACERVVVQLVLDGVLKEDFHFTPFATTYYIVEGPRKDLAIEGKIAVNLDFLVENPEKGSGERTYVSFKISICPPRLGDSVSLVQQDICLHWRYFECPFFDKSANIPRTKSHMCVTNFSQRR